MRGGAAAAAAGLDKMTPVQAATIPIALTGKDVVVRAPTGSGKTLAYSIPIVENMDPKLEGIQALVLSPLRLLANQIAEVVSKFLPTGAVLTIVGGGESRQSIEILKAGAPNVRVLVATPGVLKATLAESSQARDAFRSVRMVVLDEADKLTDVSFIRDIREILKNTPSDRQTMMFSATLQDNIIESEFLRKNEIEVVDVSGGTPEESSKKLDIDQYIASFDVTDHVRAVASMLRIHMASVGGAGKAAPKFEDLKGISSHTLEVLATWKSKSAPTGWRTMVFVQGNNYVEVFARILKGVMGSDAPVLCLHGNMPQRRRETVSQMFRDDPPVDPTTKRVPTGQVLVTSDASAMGMDYPGVTLVIQVGFSNRRDYLQRMGRTGRAGSHGVNVLLVDPVEVSYVTRQLAMAVSSAGEGCVPSEEDVRAVQYDLNALVPSNDRKRAFRAWVGFLATHVKQYELKSAEATDYVMRFSKAMDLPQPDASWVKEKLHLK